MLQKSELMGAISRVSSEDSLSAVCRDSTGNYMGSSAMLCPGINDPSSLKAIACHGVIYHWGDCVQNATKLSTTLTLVREADMKTSSKKLFPWHLIFSYAPSSSKEEILISRHIAMIKALYIFTKDAIFGYISTPPYPLYHNEHW